MTDALGALFTRLVLRELRDRLEIASLPRCDSRMSSHNSAPRISQGNASQIGCEDVR